MNVIEDVVAHLDKAWEILNKFTCDENLPENLRSYADDVRNKISDVTDDAADLEQEVDVYHILGKRYAFDRYEW